MVLGQMPPRIIPRTIASWMIAPEEDWLPPRLPRDNCPREELLPHRKISVENNCCDSSKFPTQANNDNKIVRAWYLQEAPGEHTYLPKKTGTFSVKILEIRMFLYYKNKTSGDIFEEKDIS